MHQKEKENEQVRRDGRVCKLWMGAPLKRDAEGNEGGSHVTIWGRCLPDGEKS